MRIVSLPYTSQTGLRGQVVLVPADLSKVTGILPRTSSESQIIPLSLKRRLSDKHYVSKQFIIPSFINEALTWLIAHNPHYKAVKINTDWITTSMQDEPLLWRAAVVDEVLM